MGSQEDKAGKGEKGEEIGATRESPGGFNHVLGTGQFFPFAFQFFHFIAVDVYLKNVDWKRTY